MSFVTSVYPPRKAIVETPRREDGEKLEWCRLREEIHAMLEANIKAFWEEAETE